MHHVKLYGLLISPMYFLNLLMLSDRHAEFHCYSSAIFYRTSWSPNLGLLQHNGSAIMMLEMQAPGWPKSPDLTARHLGVTFQQLDIDFYSKGSISKWDDCHKYPLPSFSVGAAILTSLWAGWDIWPYVQTILFSSQMGFIFENCNTHSCMSSATSSSKLPWSDELITCSSQKPDAGWF